MARCVTYLVLTSDEVNLRIPYALVCMTRFGAHWETGRRRRRWLESSRSRNGVGNPAVQSVSSVAVDHRSPGDGSDDGTDLALLDEAGRVLPSI